MSRHDVAEYARSRDLMRVRRNVVVDRVCIVCGKDFRLREGGSGHKVCGPACAAKHKRDYNLAYKRRKDAEERAQREAREDAIIEEKLPELPAEPNGQCPKGHKVVTGTEALTGRTWERCQCGTRWLGRWKEAA